VSRHVLVTGSYIKSINLCMSRGSHVVLSLHDSREFHAQYFLGHLTMEIVAGISMKPAL
jgi:hypothetical protein